MSQHPKPNGAPNRFSWSDTRAEYRRILGRIDFRSGRALAKFAGCAVFAVLVALVPNYPELPEPARYAFAIVLFSAGLWITEAIPAFAIALLAIGLQILILGKPGGVMAAEGDTRAWEMFVAPWASPPMWLFFGGFVLARATARAGLDRSLANRLLGVAGDRADRVLLAAMGTAFVFSMFLSNTATAAMMLAILAPLFNTRKDNARTSVTLIVGVAFAANLGGMATIIGTPPNAIASGLLYGKYPVDFLKWSLFGLPPAIILVAGLWLFLASRVRGSQISISLDTDAEPAEQRVPFWQKWTVIIVFFATVFLWLTGSWHDAPTAVVSFLPIVIFSITGLITAEDIRSLDWDILILLAGGLSLGVGVSQSGLADWIANALQQINLPAWALATAFSALILVLSNLMSNTAASNILIPVGMAAGFNALGGGEGAAQFAIPMALCASGAMCLPISTPPNAIAYASGKLRASDFLLPGLCIGIAAIVLTSIWCQILIQWL